MGEKNAWPEDLITAHERRAAARNFKPPSKGFGGRILTPNAHRCLLQAGRYLRCAWQSFRAALRHQRRGF